MPIHASHLDILYYSIPPTQSLLEPHQSVLLFAKDHLMVEVHVPKVLRYRKAAQAITGVIKIPGPGQSKTKRTLVREITYTISTDCLSC